MNKQEYIYVFGCFTTAINIVSVLNCLFVFARQFCKSVSQINNRALINFHFTLLVVALAFLAANSLALYRFYDAWIIKKSFLSIQIVLNGFADRVLMFIVSCGLVSLSLSKLVTTKRRPRTI